MRTALVDIQVRHSWEEMLLAIHNTTIAKLALATGKEVLIRIREVVSIKRLFSIENPK